MTTFKGNEPTLNSLLLAVSTHSTTRIRESIFNIVKMSNFAFKTPRNVLFRGKDSII